MPLIQSSIRVAVLLMVAVLIPPPLFSQNRQTASPPQTEQIGTAIGELLKQRPLEPKSENPAAGLDGDSDPVSDKPPADDAPINELITYWRARRYKVLVAGKDKPSDRVRERILEACENRPWLFGQLTHVLPETAETYDRIHRLLTENGKEQDSGEGWQQPLRHWLKSNSLYYREELVEEVRRLGQSNQMDLSPVHSLAQLDWDQARPLVEAMTNGADPFRAAQAWGILYDQTRRSGDSAQAEILRSQLQAMVVNRQSPVSVRQTAFQSLMAAEWSGQEEWYLSLFADPLLSGVKLAEGKEYAKTGPDFSGSQKPIARQQSDDEGGSFNILWLPVQQNPAKWLPVALRLVGSSDRMIHLAAVSCLASFLATESDAKEPARQAAQALLPWLTDPNWGGNLERWSYLGALAKMDLPESLPGLIWVLDNDEDATSRAVAAEALIRYRNPQANPALRRALHRETNEMLREPFIAALGQAGPAAGGFSDEEAMAAIEAYARHVTTPEGKKEIAEIADLTSEKTLPLPISIGRVYDERDDIELTESLAAKLFARAKAVRSAEPAAARRMLSIAERCGLVVADLNLIERIGEGLVDLDALKLALKSRERMRKRVPDELFTLFKKGGYASGMAALLLGDEDNYNNLLKGKDSTAQTALLAAARYVREKLPVDLVGKLLDSNQTLAAAENYLEVEDSAEARRLIWAKHPGEARIVGERVRSEPERGDSVINRWEEKMRNEVRSEGGSEEIYALVPNHSPDLYGSIVIRVTKGSAEINLYKFEGRRQRRFLTATELRELREFAVRDEVENLRLHDRESYGGYETSGIRFEYLRLTKDGGRRVMTISPRRPPPNGATLHEQLTGKFYQFSHTGEFKLRYDMEDRIPGLEVLLADDSRSVFTACQENRELKVLIEPEKEGRVPSDRAAAEWHLFTASQLGNVTDEPRSCGYQNSFLYTPNWLKEFRGQLGVAIDWRSKSGEVWFSPANIEGEPGIWKLEESKSPVKVVSGTYLNSIATPDGKWLVAKKTVQTADKFDLQITRIQVATGREFVVNAPQLSGHYPIAFVATHNKVLLGQGHYQYGRDFTGGTNYLLDAETGALQQVKGEFRPLQDQTARPLQATDRPNEFWAAMYDQQKKATVVGRYDARLFAFTPVVELPEIRIGSPDLWVDAAEGKLYVTYLGHLLRVPLAK